jgi:Tfp pilus assembly protein PilE
MKKAFTLLEMTITVTIVVFLIISTNYFNKEIISNNIKGAQLSLLKLYKAEKLYYKENKKYTDNLEIIWEYQKRIPEYPVTIVDFRKRSLHKEKEPILHFRIDHYYLDIKTTNNSQNFKIIAKVPTADELSKEFPIFTINEQGKRTPKTSKLWLIKIQDDDK